MTAAVTLIAALHLLSCPTVCLATSGDTWTDMQVQCLTVAETTAMLRTSAFTERHCVIQATEAAPSGIVIAQFEPASLRCSLFRYQSVCRDLVAVAATAGSDCRVLIRLGIKYPASSLSPKLTNVWLGDDVTRFDNLVCQADDTTNRFYPMDVQWTEEGAKFDGIRSFLALNKSDISFSSGISWLIRMKRLPRVQPFLEFIDCSLFETGPFLHRLWEFDNASKVYGVVKTQAGGPVMAQTTNNAVLTSNASEWVNLGLTASANATEWSLFLNGAFLPSTAFSFLTRPNFTMLDRNCFRFGKRLNDNSPFNGVVKAIAIGTGPLSNIEMQEFFRLTS